MKLLDVLKKYDRCVVRESAKLTKIYKSLLKETEEVDGIDEDVCPDCGSDPCTCESDAEGEEVAEADAGMSAKEFFSEAEADAEDACEAEDPEADVDECDAEGVEEAEDMMSAQEFFSECDADDVEKAEGDTDADVDEAEDPEEDLDEAEDPEEVDEAEDGVSAKEFFSEGDGDDEVDEAEDPEENIDESDEPDAENVDEAEEPENADKEEVDEAEDPEEDEKKLEESLKSYRRANHRLFNA